MTSRRGIRNVPESIRRRLLDLARNQGIRFNDVLQRYSAERFLYRLSASDEVDRFTLKGAALFRIWIEHELRPTRDVDFLASGPADPASVRTALGTICEVPCPEDGVVFDPATIRVDSIREEQPYGGQRARLQGRLGQTRLDLRIDIGFGDVVTPAREEQDYPTLLDLPAPHLWTYPRETLVAEKLHALVQLGERSSRVKDLWDIACVARRFAFDGETVRTAVAETFRRRGTSLAGERPAALLPDYYRDSTRAQRWQALWRQIGPGADGPARLMDAGDDLRRFLGPVCDSLIKETPFTQDWPPGGPWRPGFRPRTGAERGG